MANAAPTQRWRPAPNGIQVHGFGRSSCARLEVAVRVEGVGVGEVLGNAVRDRRRRRDQVARLDR